MQSIVMQPDLSKLPVFFVSRTHFTDHDLHALEDSLEAYGAALTYNIVEAKIILSKVSKRTRLLFDLRAAGLTLKEIPIDANLTNVTQITPAASSKADTTQTSALPGLIPIGESSTKSEGEAVTKTARCSSTTLAETPVTAPLADGDMVRVVSLQWLEDSCKACEALPLNGYTVFLGRLVTTTAANMIATNNQNFGNNRTKADERLGDPAAENAGGPQSARLANPAILVRAKEDASSGHGRSFKRKFGQSAPGSMPDKASWAAGHTKVQHAHLLHATTSEEDHGYSDDLPEPPDWALKGVKYSCQRTTLAGSPNEEFVAQLRKIKLARLLTSDDIGVRAYSTSIAALLAYPYKLISPREIVRLPGCDAKIANIFVEWANSGMIKAVEDIEADHDLKVLRLFYDIWGVGALTARDFYYDRGWQDLDDLVDYNWKGLSRVQQVGVKFFEEFLEKIPRAEVEQIGEIIHRHAVKVRDAGVQSMIVGGYRRGKQASGDVDVIVSHPDESKTLNIVADIVASLEDEGWITHTLLLSLNSTHRHQQTLPFRSGTMHGGHGFDNLDKAFVVWQDTNWPTQEADLAANPKAKNPNVHRRVDIIIAPWRTVGCAVLGWSGGTTFQRDIRRYVRHEFGYKFDSSGVRDRSNGDVIDLEGFDRYKGKLGMGRAKSMVEAEKRVFEGLKLEYREAYERCTD